jgi:hypothetical protein
LKNKNLYNQKVLTQRSWWEIIQVHGPGITQRRQQDDSNREKRANFFTFVHSNQEQRRKQVENELATNIPGLKNPD